jgi:ribosomal protein S18 acetylase RimI-like enzyme
MDIRLATPEDYREIVALVPNREELYLVYPKGKHPFTVSQLQELAESRKELTVAVQDGRVVGFANLYGLQSEKWVFIGNVVIQPTFRGSGLGQKLVEHMVQLAFEKYRVPEVRISVFNSNVPALLLYGTLGFRPYDLEQRIDPEGNRVALIHMRLQGSE